MTVERISLLGALAFYFWSRQRGEWREQQFDNWNMCFDRTIVTSRHQKIMREKDRWSSNRPTVGQEESQGGYTFNNKYWYKIHTNVYLVNKLSLDRYYWKWDFPMTLSVRPSVVRRTVGLSVCHHFLNGREVSLPCSYRSTCFCLMHFFQGGDETTPTSNIVSIVQEDGTEILINADTNLDHRPGKTL